VFSLNRFDLCNSRLQWIGLGAVYGVSPAMGIGVRWAVFDNKHKTGTPLADENSARLPRVKTVGYWRRSTRLPFSARRFGAIHETNRTAQCGRSGTYIVIPAGDLKGSWL